jgi:hypothetical protein
MLVTLKEARMLIDAGVFTRVYLVKGLEAGTWELVFEKKLGDSCQLKTERGHVRSFPTVESALRILEQLGIRPSSLEFKV